MVDFRPLLFANALILMLLVTAGFASLRSDATDPAPPARDAGPETPGPGDAEATARNTSQPHNPDSPVTDRPATIGPFVDADDPESDSPVSDSPVVAPAHQLDEPKPEVAKIELLHRPTIATGPVEVAMIEIDGIKPEFAAGLEPEQKKPATSSLVVRSNVYGDKVSINGRDYGSTRLDLELTPGRYHVVISKAGHQTWDDTVQLGAGESHNLTAELIPFRTVEFRNGTWRGSIVSGEGTYVNEQGLRYEGDFRNRRFHGEGEARYPDGSEYTGEWANGKPDGRGTLRLKNGDIYSGQFARGVYSGEGSLTTAKGDIFTGTWADGRLNGQGTLTSGDGKLYVGGFLKGEFHGEGTLTYPDGRHYEGGFADGKYHGKGSLIFADGKKYQGQLMEGQYHGQGDLLNPNGSRITGNFRYGEPYGQARLTTPEGEVFTARTNDPGVCYRENSYRATQCPPMPGW